MFTAAVDVMDNLFEDYYSGCTKDSLQNANRRNQSSILLGFTKSRTVIVTFPKNSGEFNPTRIQSSSDVFDKNQKHRHNFHPTTTIPRIGSLTHRHESRHNCSTHHPSTSSGRYIDYIAILIHFKGSNTFENFRANTITLPNNPWQRAVIGQRIWFAFEQIKTANEEERKGIQEGRKREAAPIPWLRWARPDGRTGKTRSQENFKSWWIVNVTGCDREEGREVISYVTVLFAAELDV